MRPLIHLLVILSLSTVLTTAYGITPSTHLSMLATQWWRQEVDDGLREWVSLVLEHHPETQQGILRLEAAELRLRQAEQRLLPFLEATVSGQRASIEGEPQGVTQYNANVGLKYEVDLWGAGRQQVQAKRLSQRAAMADEQAQQVMLSTLAAQAYLQRAFALAAWRQAHDALADAKEVLRLVTLQQRLGKVSALELAQAQATLEEQRLREQDVRLALALSRLSALEMLGCTLESDAQTPSVPTQAQGASSCEESLREVGPAAPVPDVPPVSPPMLTQLAPPPPTWHTLGLSAVTQRPDLQAAALRLQSLANERNAIDRSFLPTFSIGVTLSQLGMSLTEALSNPVKTLLASLTLMETRLGERRTAKALADNAIQQALLQYQAALRLALLDLQSVAQRHKVLLEQADTLRSLLAQQQESERVYALRFRVGAVDLRVWLDAQNQLREAQRAVLENRLAQYLNQLTWWQTLGAGVNQREF